MQCSATLPLLIVKLGSVPDTLLGSAGDFQHYFCRGLGVPLDRCRIVEVARGASLPPVGSFSGAILSGSGSMVSEVHAWRGPLESWLHRSLEREIPLLGVCYGHQLLAHILGGQVDWAPAGPEFGTFRIMLSKQGRQDPLFAGLGPELRCQQWHRQAVLKIPPGARILAHSPGMDCQAFAWGERAWGIQFHAEFTPAVVRGFIAARRPLLRKLNANVQQIQAELEDSGHGRRVLRNFADAARSASVAGAFRAD